MGRSTHIFPLLAYLLLAACGGNGGGAAVNAGNGNTGGTGVVPKGARLMEIQVSEAADGDFVGAFNLAQSVGMDSASLSLDWNGVDIGTDNSTGSFSKDYTKGKFKSNLHGRMRNYLQKHRRINQEARTQT